LNITLEYTAPEILRGEKRSIYSDYWSLGCLLYEMVVGIAPYYNDNTELVIYLIIKNELKFPTGDDKISYFSPECKEVISALLNSSPSARPTFE
jgi:serum/glucocorticoid-regulated kinase 2